MKDPENNWDPAHFEQVLEQRAIDGAVQAAIDRIAAEYAKNNQDFPQAAQDKMRLGLANALRGKIRRRSATPEQEGDK